MVTQFLVAWGEGREEWVPSCRESRRRRAGPLLVVSSLVWEMRERDAAAPFPGAGLWDAERAPASPSSEPS